MNAGCDDVGVDVGPDAVDGVIAESDAIGVATGIDDGTDAVRAEGLAGAEVNGTDDGTDAVGAEAGGIDDGPGACAVAIGAEVDERRSINCWMSRFCSSICCVAMRCCAADCSAA